MTKEKKSFKMPSAYVIVFIALFITVVMTHFIPVSSRDPLTGDVHYNAIIGEDGQLIENVGPQPKGIWGLLTAPILGFQSASDVGIALFIAGGFLKVLNVTGALESGIGKMIKKLQGNVLIAIMIFVFAVMGTVFGFWEEITAFALVIVPLFVLAGYDVMTGLGVMFVGASIGNMSAIVNPFSTGAAVSAIGNPSLTLGSGIILRSVIFLVLYIVGTTLVVRYASKIKANPELSVLANVSGVKTSVDGDDNVLPEMTTKRAISLALFIVMVVFLLVGYVPWFEIGGEALYNIVNAPIAGLAKIPLLGDILGAKNATPFGEWGFTEFSFLFFVGSLLLLIINKLKIDDFIDNFIAGAKDLLGVVLVLSISRGIAIIMGESTQGMSVTFVYWISNGLSKAPIWIFAIVASLAFILIGVFLQSTSGVAGISMPILGAVAASLFISTNVGSIGGQIILMSAFSVGLNFMTSLYPDAVNMGTINLFNVPYDKYLKFMLKIMIPLLIVGIIIITIAPYIGLVI